VELDQIELVRGEALTRPLEAGAGALRGALVRLRGQEEAVAMPRHPRAHTQLRIAIHGGRVDVVHAVLEQQLEERVSLVLAHAAERRGAEDDAAADVPGAPERDLLHGPSCAPQRLYYARRRLETITSWIAPASSPS
jgi:hypothetical protein